MSKIQPFSSTWQVHRLHFSWSCPACLLPTHPIAKALLSKPLFQVHRFPCSWTPNPTQKSLSPAHTALHPLLQHSFAPWQQKILTFPPPTAALVPLLQFSACSCHPLCSLWATRGRLSARNTQPGRKLSGSSNQGRGIVIRKERVERSCSFFSFFKQNDRQTEGKGNTPLQILGYSGGVVLYQIIAFYCRALLNGRRLFKHQCQILCNLLSNKLLKEHGEHHLSDLHSLLTGFYTCLLFNFTARTHPAAFIPSFHRAGWVLFCVWKAAPFKCTGSYSSAAFRQIRVFGAFSTSSASRADYLSSPSS